MTLYSIYADTNTYRALGFDSDQMFNEYGSLINHFNINYKTQPFLEKMKSPFNVNFSKESSEFSGNEIPDITEHYGRLFLNQKAYKALKDILQNDGEFLPVICDDKDAYMLNPLRLAETVGGLNKKLSIKDTMGNGQNIAFHSDKVNNFVIFKTEFDGFISAYCQESLKDAIETANLKGVFFTQDLGNRLTTPP